MDSVKFLHFVDIGQATILHIHGVAVACKKKQQKLGLWRPLAFSWECQHFQKRGGGEELRGAACLLRRKYAKRKFKKPAQISIQTTDCTNIMPKESKMSPNVTNLRDDHLFKGMKVAYF